jgi:hypothetical protein
MNITVSDGLIKIKSVLSSDGFVVDDAMQKSDNRESEVELD